MIDDKTLQIVIALAAVIVTAIRLFGRNKEKSPLSTDEFRPFPLQKIEVLSHDTKRYTFALPTETTKLGLPIGQHISFRFTDSENKTHQRSYTPVTGNETLGKVSFCIKTYRAGVHPKFPDGGKMSQHLDSLSVGDTVDMKGPKGHLDYLGKGKFSVKKMRKPLQFRRAKHFGLLSGGTGITPMLQVISAVLKGDKGITLSLIYANQTEDDILVRDELEALVSEYPDRFKLHYTLDRPPANWKYSTGFITKEMIEEHLPSKASDQSTQILMCGPPPMVRFACIPNLEALGFKEDEYFSF